jgi:hypothetical protein
LGEMDHGDPRRAAAVPRLLAGTGLFPLGSQHGRAAAGAAFRNRRESQIAQPINGAIVRPGRPVRIFGAAWSGEASIAGVEVSTGDAGSSRLCSATRRRMHGGSGNTFGRRPALAITTCAAEPPIGRAMSSRIDPAAIARATWPTGWCRWRSRQSLWRGARS